MPQFARGDDDTAGVAWVEIHNENFLCDGGPRLAMLDAIAARVPISCHGVGLSLGSADGLDRDHLKRLQQLFERVRPGLVSEHLAWSVASGDYLNDLLPLPTTPETLDVLVRNVDTAQQAFGRQILVENPSTYLQFTESTIPEPAFLNALAERTGCGVLLDVNNIYVSAMNTGTDAAAMLDAFDPRHVGEIHLAGHSRRKEDGEEILIDTHSTRVCDAVWTLYADAIARMGPRPTLIEWDMDIPPLATLRAEADAAQNILDGVTVRSHVA